MRGSELLKKRIQVLKHGGCRCAYCGVELKPNNFTIDHKYPKSKGGDSSIKNLKPSCRFCNHIKGPLNIKEFKNLLLELSHFETVLGKKVKSKFNLGGENAIVKFYYEEKKDERCRLMNLLNTLECSNA